MTVNVTENVHLFTHKNHLSVFSPKCTYITTWSKTP